MRVEYFPLDERYKSPVGGIEINKSFTIRAVFGNTDSALFVLTKEGENEQSVYYPMTKNGDEFRLTMQVTSSGLYFYHFETGNGKFFADELLCPTTCGDKQWQLTAFEKKYQTPDFTDGGIIYQIMVDRFATGGKSFRTKAGSVYREDWGATPTFRADEKGIVHNNDMFGGNLYGVIEKLDYLKSLNVKCIYLNPIFEAASNHKYDTGSYRRVDGDFGGDEALRALIKAAKEKGISIMLDGVFSHTGDDSVYFNRYHNYDSVGAYDGEKSPYYDWYDFQDFPEEYTSWWGIKLLPCVNETNPQYNEFINGEDGIVRTYLRMGIAGWRLDVADELPDAFLDNLTKAAKAENPKAMVLGEVWEDASNKWSYGVRRRYFCGAQLDSVTNYPFKNAIIDYVRNGNARSIAAVVVELVNNYPAHVLNKLMNLVGTHDTARILTELSGVPRPEPRSERAVYRLKDKTGAVQRVKLAAALQYTLPGVPCVYYGDEAGMEGYEDPFNRRCYPWGNEDKSLIDYYKKLGKLRRRDDLIRGGFILIKASDGILAYKRGKLTVVANMSDTPYDLGGEKVNILTGASVTAVDPITAVVYEEKA